MAAAAVAGGEEREVVLLMIVTSNVRYIVAGLNRIDEIIQDPKGKNQRFGELRKYLLKKYLCWREQNFK